MPVDYLHVDAIAMAVADIYAEAENALLAAITRQLQAGGFDDDTASRWQVRKLAEARALHRTAQLLVDELQRDGNVAVRQAVADGWRSGNATALTDLTEQHIGDIGPAARVADQTPGRAIQALADATVAELRPVHSAVLRGGDDAYRRAVAGGAARKLTGARDLRRAVQDTWAGLTRQGITGFVDTTGRRWRLSTYAEMAVRTAVARAAVVGEVDAMTGNGIDMCYVVDNPRECPICRPFEAKILALRAPAERPAIATLDEAMAAGLFHPNCFPGGVLVSAPSGVRASDSRWYEGELVVVHTAGGEELPVTPNHPVLTPEGWVAAGALQVGDDVLRHRGWDEWVHAGAAGARPGDEQIPARIGEVHRALTQASPVPPVRMPGAAEQFHGDGGDAEVEVVLTDRLLADGVLSGLGEGVHNVPLVVGGTGLGALLADRPAFHVLLGEVPAPYGVMGGGGELGPLRRSHSGQSSAHGFAPADPGVDASQDLADPGLRKPVARADLRLGELAGAVQPGGLRGPVLGPAALPGYAGGVQPVVDGLTPNAERGGQVIDRLAGLVPVGKLGNLRRGEFGSAVLGALPQRHPGSAESAHDRRARDVEGGRELARGLAGVVATDQVLKLERRRFAGHVYNLQTGDGWYVAGGIVVSNCRHQIRPWQPGVRIMGARKPEGPEGYTAEQRQRQLERGLRAWRERYAAAFDDTGRQYAAKRIAGWSQRLHEHLDANPKLARITYREHPGAGFRAPRSSRTRRDAAYLASRA